MQRQDLMGLPMNRSSPGPSKLRMAGAGMELAATILLCMFLGYQLDRWLGTSEPWGLIVGALLGMTGSIYRMYLSLKPKP